MIIRKLPIVFFVFLSLYSCDRSRDECMRHYIVEEHETYDVASDICDDAEDAQTENMAR